MPALPGYEILEELGSGGMGVVFKARHLELGRIVALKMLRDGALADADLRARFRDEARAAARLHHPGIVQIYDVGTLDGLPYLALEYVPGPSLDRVLRDSPLPPRDAAALLVPLAEALQVAHERGILHRDLKPANILLAQKSEIRTLKSETNPKSESEDNQTTERMDLSFSDFGVASQGDRLWSGQAAARRQQPDPVGHGGRHAVLHGPGAGSGAAETHGGGGCLCVGGDPV